MCITPFLCVLQCCGSRPKVLFGSGDLVGQSVLFPIRVQFAEEEGPAYISDMGVRADVRTPQKVVVLFEGAKWGSWSKPDPDGKLVPEHIRRLLIGINSDRNSKVVMSIRNLRWVRLR